MKKIIVACFVLYSYPGFSQMIEMRNYEWERKPVIHQLSDAELKEPSLLLKEKRVMEYVYDRDGNLEQYYFRHKIIHINEDKAIEEYNKISVQVGTSSDLLSFKARSITKDGKVKEMLRGEMKDITEEGSLYMILAVDGLEKGGELEYFFLQKIQTSYFLTETFQSHVMSKNVEMTLISPENLIFESKPYNGFPACTDTVINKKRISTASIALINPANDEKYAAYRANLMRMDFKLAKNTAKDYSRMLTWGDAGKNYYNRIHNFEKGEMKDLDKLVSKLKLKNMKSDDEKISAIENYVKTNISSQGSTSDISEILKKNYASEFGLIKLTAGMLQQSEINFDIVATCNRFTQKFDPDFDTWNFLDETFFYFPSSGKYLAPTNYLYRLGMIPFYYTDNHALFVKEISLGDIKSGVGTVKKIPESKPELSHHNQSISIEFSPSMDKVMQHTHLSLLGYMAVGLRPYYFYDTDDKKEELLKEPLKNGIEDAKLTNVKAVNFNLNSDEVNKDFQVDGDLTYSSLLEKAGDTYIFKVGAVIGPQVEMYQEKPRQCPVEMEFPHSEDRFITVTIPKGFAVKGLDALKINITGGEGGEKAMGFICDYKLEGQKLTININEFYNHCHFPLSIFEQFRKVINSSADFNKVSLVLEKK